MTLLRKLTPKTVYSNQIRNAAINTAAENLKHFEKVNPKDAKLMLNTTFETVNKKGVVKIKTLFDKVQMFKLKTFDQRIVFDPKVAGEIAKAIHENSDAKNSDEIPIFDADGGLCLVSRIFRKKYKRPVKIFQYSEDFLPLTKTHFPKKKVEIFQENVIQMSHSLKRLQINIQESQFYAQSVNYRNGWDNPCPGFTCFIMNSDVIVSFLMEQCLHSWENSNETLFKNIRPEFFLLVNAKSRTFLLSEIKKNSFRLRQWNNYIFRCLFDRQEIMECSAEAFMPWERAKKSHLYDHKKLHLIKIRPKLDIGLENPSEFKASDFIHLAEIVTSGGNKERFLPNIDKYVPKVGHDLIKDAGFSVMTKNGEVLPKHLVPIYNIVVKQKTFDSSAFIPSSELHKNSRYENVITSGNNYHEI